MRNRLLTVALGLVLSGCNMVISDEPWFTEPGPVQQKTGLWVMLEKADCPVSATTSLAAMPDCASPILIIDGAYSGPPNDRSLPDAVRYDPAKWDRIDHVLTDGTPMVDQLRFDATKPNPGAPPPVFKDKLTYLYLAVKPTGFDAEGRIISAKRWPVMCGPLTRGEKDASGGPRFVTARPYAGMSVVHDMACNAADVAALREAAVTSEVSAPLAVYQIMESRWLRDLP